MKKKIWMKKSFRLHNLNITVLWVIKELLKKMLALSMILIFMQNYIISLVCHSPYRFRKKLLAPCLGHLYYIMFRVFSFGLYIMQWIQISKHTHCYQHKLTYKGDVDRGIMFIIICAASFKYAKSKTNMKDILINNKIHKIS